MSYWILPESGIPISCTTVQPMYHIDKQTDENKQRMQSFDEKIRVKFNAPAPVPVKNTNTFNPYHLNPYLTMEISLPRGTDASHMVAQVIKRATDENDQPLGTPHNNPLMDSRRYDVEFVDGYSETLSANILAENSIAQVDQEGHRQRMLKEISDHRCNDRAIKIEDGTFTISRGLKQKRRTTAG